jgi:ATP-dependent Clp protease ATP-binding subunit ClpC
VRRKPYSVLLLDEIEKAHPDVFNILLQILEDGRLTDAQGRTVDFRNAIVIMTSNIGAKDIARNVSFGFGTSDETGASYEEMKDRIMGELKKVFRPEFLNRIDEVIVFHKLTRDEIKEIIELMIGRVRAQVAEHELQLELDEQAKELLVDKGWDPAMGARPLRRAIQRYIEDPLADEVLRTGNIVPGTTVLVERDESSEDEDRPLKMKLVKPRKRPAKKREPVGVGAAASSEGEGSSPQREPAGEGGPDESADGEDPSPEDAERDGQEPSTEPE